MAEVPAISRFAYAGTSLTLSFSFLSDRKEVLLRGTRCEAGLVVVEWFRDKADRIVLVVSAGRCRLWYVWRAADRNRDERRNRVGEAQPVK